MCLFVLTFCIKAHKKSFLAHFLCLGQAWTQVVHIHFVVKDIEGKTSKLTK